MASGVEAGRVERSDRPGEVAQQSEQVIRTSGLPLTAESDTSHREPPYKGRLHKAVGAFAVMKS